MSFLQKEYDKRATRLDEYDSLQAHLNELKTEIANIEYKMNEFGDKDQLIAEMNEIKGYIDDLDNYARLSAMASQNDETRDNLEQNEIVVGDSI